MRATKKITQRYECSRCGWRWSRDFKAPMDARDERPIYIVPRHLSDSCECDESVSNGDGGRQSAFGEVE
jgi:hypothetical protein